MNLKEMKDAAQVRLALARDKLEQKKRRSRYTPSRSQNCIVCGKHWRITEYNHYLPVAMAAHMGVRSTDGDWFCPNHHAIFHKFDDLKLENWGSAYVKLYISEMTEDEVAALKRCVERRREVIHIYLSNPEFNDRYHKSKYGIGVKE